MKTKTWMAVVCMAMIVLVSACTLPKLKPGPRACIDSREGWHRCSNDELYIEECSEGTWVAIEDCSSKNKVCDESVGDVATNQTLECAVGCIYEEQGYLVGEQGCYNETTYGECQSGGRVEITDCSATEGMVCYNNTCTRGCIFEANAYPSGDNFCKDNVAYNCMDGEVSMLQNCSETGMGCSQGECI